MVDWIYLWPVKPGTPVIYSIQFLVVNILGTDFRAVSCIEACFVEESIDSAPIFNVEFFPLLSFRTSNAD